MNSIAAAARRERALAREARRASFQTAAIVIGLYLPIAAALILSP